MEVKLTNESGDEIPRSPGAGAEAEQEEGHDHLGGGGWVVVIPQVVLLQLAQHRENGSELTKLGGVC